MKAGYFKVFFRLCKEDLKINRKGSPGDYHKKIKTLSGPQVMTKQHKMQHTGQHKNELSGMSHGWDPGPSGDRVTLPETAGKV